MSGNGKTTEVVYDGLATVGRVRSYFQLVIANLVLVPLLLVALWLILRHRKYTGSVTGTVTAEAPNTCSGPNDMSCTITYEFTLPPPHGPQTRTETVTRERQQTTKNGVSTTSLPEFPYRLGNDVTVWYDPNDPVGTARLQNDDMRKIGVIMGLIVLVLLGLAWLWWHLTQRYKAVAALGGAATALEVAGSAFR